MGWWLGGLQHHFDVKPSRKAHTSYYTNQKFDVFWDLTSENFKWYHILEILFRNIMNKTLLLCFPEKLTANKQHIIVNIHHHKRRVCLLRSK